MEKTCHKCGNHLKEGMKFCPKCGQAISEEREKGAQRGTEKAEEKVLPKKKRKTVLWIVCGLVIGLFIVMGFSNDEPEKESVINAARNVVHKQLTAPSTAVYSGEEILDEDDYGRYLVYVDVDSENGFGAQVRTEWVVIVFSVTEDTFRYNNQMSYVNNEDGTDVQGELALSLLKELNDWNKPLEE